VPPLPRLEPPLIDGRVLLRHWTERDVDAMTAGLADPEVTRWTSIPTPYTREHAVKFIADAREAHERGERLELAVVEVDGERVIGAISLRFNWEHRRADVGSAMFRGHRGRGLGQRAGRLLFAYAFETLGLRRIEVLADERNVASIQGSEGAGFRREAVLRSYMHRNGVRVAMVMLSLLPRDFPLQTVL
jgi:RimJ/RimL family protein N-acetyltransferase